MTKASPVMLRVLSPTWNLEHIMSRISRRFVYGYRSTSKSSRAVI